MRVLIISVPSIGHARPMASVAARLTSRGHDVHWAANETVGYVRRAGATLHSVLPDELSEDGISFEGDSPHEIDRWFLEQWFVPIAEQALGPTLELARALDPDLLVVDSTALWGAMVADVAGATWASYCPGLYMGSLARQAAIQEIQHPHLPLDWAVKDAPSDSTYWEIERRLNALRYGVDLAAEANLNRISVSLLICFTTRAIEFDGAGLPDQARCVGPVFGSRDDLDPFADHEPQLPPGKQPLVFVSLGRVQARFKGFVEPVLSGLADLEVRTFVAASAIDETSIPAGGSVTRAVGPVSQPRLLDETAVLVGSGGFNTVHEALCHGVPVVAMPVAGDEPALAARIDELGLGIAITEADRDPAGIRDAVAHVLDDEAYRERARAFALDARLVNGVSTSVRLLESLQRDGTVERSEDERIMEQLPIRPRWARRFQLLERGHGVAVASYSEDLEVPDPLSAEAVRWLRRTADGTTGLSELLDSWDGDVTLVPIVAGLTQKGVLEENVGKVRIDDMTSDRYRDQITMFSHAQAGGSAPHVSLRGDQFQERLLAARVTVVGAGILGSNIVRNLSLCGFGSLILLDTGPVDEALIAKGGWYRRDHVGAARVDALAAEAQELRPDLNVVTGRLPVPAEQAGGSGESPLGDSHLVIVATDGFDPDLYAWIDQVCQQDRRQWTSIRRNRMTVELGPTVIPDQSACFRCYELRRSANVPDEIGQGRTHAGWYYVPAGADWIALEAVKLLSGFGEAVTVGRVMVFDSLALTLVGHRLLRLPNCPRCKVNGRVPPHIPWMPLSE